MTWRLFRDVQGHEQRVCAAAVRVSIVGFALPAVSVTEATIECLRLVVVGTDFEIGNGRRKSREHHLMQGSRNPLPPCSGDNGKGEQFYFVQDVAAGNIALRPAVRFCQPDAITAIGAADARGIGRGRASQRQ